MAEVKRRGYGEDGIYFDHGGDCRDSAHHKTRPGRWRGVVSLGFDADGKRIRKKVSGQTRTEVKDKLKALHSELDAGVRTVQSYTVESAVTDWLAEGLPGRAATPLVLHVPGGGANGYSPQRRSEAVLDDQPTGIRTAGMFREVSAAAEGRTPRGSAARFPLVTGRRSAPCRCSAERPSRSRTGRPRRNPGRRGSRRPVPRRTSRRHRSCPRRAPPRCD